MSNPQLTATISMVQLIALFGKEASNNERSCQDAMNRTTNRNRVIVTSDGAIPTPSIPIPLTVDRFQSLIFIIKSARFDSDSIKLEKPSILIPILIP